MKYASFICLVLVSLVACAPKKSTGETFGAKFEPKNVVAAAEVKNLLKDKDSVNVMVEGKINECCQKKGCWMTVDIGNNETMHVSFKDYEFFVPKDAGGKTTVLNGVLKKTVMSVEELQHYAKDAGKSDSEIAEITEPVEEIEFVADGVIIK